MWIEREGESERERERKRERGIKGNVDIYYVDRERQREGGRYR